MAGLSASGLITQIRSYTETDSNVLTDAVCENIILNSQYRIFRDVPIDADRKQQLGNFVAGQESINSPAGALFIRGIQVYDTAGSAITGAQIGQGSGYAITTGKYVSDTGSGSPGRNTSDYMITNFFFFTVNSDTATTGSVKGGGYGCSVGPITIEG